MIIHVMLSDKSYLPFLGEDFFSGLPGIISSYFTWRLVLVVSIGALLLLSVLLISVDFGPLKISMELSRFTLDTPHESLFRKYFLCLFISLVSVNISKKTLS